jgi:hypothetical protein
MNDCPKVGPVISLTVCGNDNRGWTGERVMLVL